MWSARRCPASSTCLDFSDPSPPGVSTDGPPRWVRPPARPLAQVSMNGMMEMVMGFEGMKKGIKHIPGPEGVRGRNSDNKLILEKLGWEPTIKLQARGRPGERLPLERCGVMRQGLLRAACWCTEVPNSVWSAAEHVGPYTARSAGP